MDVPAPPLSRAQIIAYELASLYLHYRVEDIAHRIWRAMGEDSLIGRLIDEARWTISVLRDRMASCACRNAGVSKLRLASHAFEPDEPLLLRPRRLRAIHHPDARLDARDLSKIVAVVFACRATLQAMFAGYGAAYPSTHALMAAFRAADAALEAVLCELTGLGEGASRSSRAPRVSRDRTAGTGTLLLLRERFLRKGNVRLSARRLPRYLPPSERS